MRDWFSMLVSDGVTQRDKHSVPRLTGLVGPLPLTHLPDRSICEPDPTGSTREQHAVTRAPSRSGLRQLALSLALLRLGQSLGAVALPLLVLQRHGFSLNSGAVLGAALLPNVLLGVFAGQVIEKFEARSVAIVAGVVNAAVVVCFPVTIALWQILVLSLLVGASNMLGYPARLALRSSLMPAGEETQGNSTLVVSERAATLLGPAAAGAILTVAALTWLFVAEGLFSLLAAAAMLRVQPARRQVLGEQGAAGIERWTFVRDTKNRVIALIQLLRADRMLRGLAVTSFTYVAALGVSTAMLAAFAVQSFSGIPGALGYLVAAMGAGGALGALVARRLARVPSGRLYTVGNVAEGLCWVGVPFTTVLPVALALLVVAGILESLATVAYFAESQRRLPAAQAGRFYAVFIPLTDVFRILGTAVGAFLVGRLGVPLAAATMAALITVPVLLASRSLLGGTPETRLRSGLTHQEDPP